MAGVSASGRGSEPPVGEEQPMKAKIRATLHNVVIRGK
jgi:hypothetical protein